jgi:HEAT repeat protein
MARDQLLALTTDVDRIFAAGGSAAGGNEKLRRHGQALRELSRQVPAITPLADTVDRVVQASGKQASAAFLDLVLMARQLRYSLSASGVAGDMKAGPQSGPWATPHSARALFSVSEALTNSGSGREETLRDALERKLTDDLRLVPALLDALGDGYAPVAEMVAEQALPAVGKAIVPDLLIRLDHQGKTVDARRLAALCRVDPLMGAELCRQSLQNGSPPLRIQALKSLPDVAKPADAEKAGLELSRDKSRDVRAAALSALRTSKSNPALERLLEAETDRDDQVRDRGSFVLISLPHPQVTPRLLGILESGLQKLAEAQALARVKKKPTAKGKKTAAPEVDAEELRQKAGETIRWALVILGERKDKQCAAAARAIVPLVDHADEEVQRHALDALGSIGPVIPEVVTALIRVVKEGKGDAVESAVEALQRFEPAVQEPAVPALLELAGRQGKGYQPGRWEAIQLLPQHVAKHGKAIVALLCSLLQEKDQWLGDAAAEALTECGVGARAAIPDLLKYFQRGSLFSDDSTTFYKIDPQGTQSIAGLIELLRSRKDNIQCRALNALAPYGSAASQAIPEVTRIIETTKKDDLRRYAERTLAALQP